MAKEFDLIVMGAGIIGAACAYEATLRGLNVLLLDKSDFGSETSAGSFKIIHGGLRYLQHFDLPRLKESFQEQKFIRFAAPNQVRPLPFLVPCYGYGMKGRSALRLACSIYEFISKVRNDGISDALKLPDHQVLSKEDVLKVAPLLEQKNLTGGVVFYDCQMLNPDRLTLQVIRSAEQCGAIVRNYNEVKQIFTSKINNSYKIEEILVRDHKSKLDYKVRAKTFINALGPWGSQIGRLFDGIVLENDLPSQVYSKGIQLVFPEIIGKYALSVQGKGIDSSSNVSRGGRAFFFQPWNGHTLIGTTDSIYKDQPENNKIRLSEIKEFLKELHEAYPSDMLKPLYVKFAFGGLRTVDKAVLKQIDKGVVRDGMVNTSRDEEIIDHAKTNWAGLAKIENLISSIGIKYTTFRSVGEKVVEMLKNFDLDLNTNNSANRKLFGSEDLPHVDELMGSCMEKGFRYKLAGINNLVQNYGADARFLLEDAQNVSKVFNMDSEKAVLFSKAKFACRFEYAHKLSDLVTRRLDISSLGFPGHPVVDELSKYMAELMGWDEDRRLSEIQELNEKFTFAP